MVLLLAGILIGAISTLVLNLNNELNIGLIILEFLGFSIGTIVLIIVIFVILSFFVSKKKDVVKPNKLFSLFTYIVFDFLLIIFRVKINVVNKELVDFNNRYLVVSNHQSNIDPFIFIKIFNKLGLTFIIKKELTKFFIFKRWAHVAGYYSLDRSNNRSAIKTIKQGIEAVQVRSIAIFPEGTRSKDGSLLEFKDGAFKISQKGEVDVLVCMIDDVYNVKKRFPFRSTKVTLKICGVITKEEVKTSSTTEISNKAYEMINTALIENRK